MCASWRKTVFALLGAACVAALIYAQAVAAKKGGGGGDDGGGTPPGTIFYWDDGVQAVIGMDGAGNNAYVASPYKGYPSYGSYGDDGHRWFLTTMDVPGAAPNPDGLGRRELVALRPDASLPGGAEWVQLTDLDGRTQEAPLNLVEIICPTYSNAYTDVVPTNGSWARDDSFVSFLGIDYRNSTYGIFRVAISALEVEHVGSDTTPCSLDNLEKVVIIPTGQSMRLQEPTWSPLGDQVAYSLRDISGSGGPPYSLYLHTVGSNEPDVLLWSGAYNDTIAGLDWSPDGAKIAFIRRGNFFVVVGSVNGDPTVTEVPYKESGVRFDYGNLRWSPDSQYFALAAHKYLNVDSMGGSRWDIGSMSASGGRITLFTAQLDDRVYRNLLGWSP